MSAEPVLGWDAHVLVAYESAFGTTPDPAGSQALEFVSCSMGGSELGQIRAQRDRNDGRGMTAKYVEGRVPPMPWSIETSIKSRAAVDTTPKEDPLYLAGGLLRTTNASTSVVYTTANDPVAASAFSSLSMRRSLGTRGSSVYEAEQLRGGITKTLTWSGGDKEVMLQASGVAQGKRHLGYALSVTLANDSTTSLDLGTTEAAYAFGLGLYIIESEVVEITAVDVSSHIATIVRGALSTSAVAHSAKPIMPYMPSPTLTGSPISEGTSVSCTLDSQTLRILSWQVALTTGADALPGESGSKYIQGAIFKRYDSKVTLKALLRREGVSMLGKATAKKTPLALTLSQGSAAGGIVTFTYSNLELDPIVVPDTANDGSIVDISLRNFGSEFTLTQT